MIFKSRVSKIIGYGVNNRPKYLHKFVFSFQGSTIVVERHNLSMNGAIAAAHRKVMSK